MIDNYLLVNLQFFLLDNCGWHVGTLLPYGINLVSEAHGGIVLPILWIVGVQFTENVRFYGCSLVSQLVYNNCGRPALISILCFYYVDNCQGVHLFQHHVFQFY